MLMQMVLYTLQGLPSLPIKFPDLTGPKGWKGEFLLLYITAKVVRLWVVVFVFRFLERENERETFLSYLLYATYQELRPKSGHMPWPGIEPATFRCTSWYPAYRLYDFVRWCIFSIFFKKFLMEMLSSPGQWKGAFASSFTASCLKVACFFLHRGVGTCCWYCCSYFYHHCLLCHLTTSTAVMIATNYVTTVFEPQLTGLGLWAGAL